MLDKAKHVWNMLDELASSDPTAYKNYIEKTLKEGKEWLAPPTPCLAVRSTLHSNSNIKLFYLNIFTWLRLPEPVKTDELTKMYSLTPIETVINNESCIIVNIAVHPNVMKIISHKQLIRSTFDLVVSQHQLLVNRDKYEILKDKFIGNLEETQKNFVKPLSKSKENVPDFSDTDLDPSLIQQISSMTTSDSTPSQPAKKSVQLIEELWTIPRYTEEITANSTFLIIRVSLPDCQSVSDCEVTVLPKENVVQVECRTLHMQLKIDMKKCQKANVANMDSTFDIQRLTAKFVRKSQQMVLTIPILLEEKTED